MENALIGFSGFVGSSLLKQTEFGHLYHQSTLQILKTILIQWYGRRHKNGWLIRTLSRQAKNRWINCTFKNDKMQNIHIDQRSMFSKTRSVLMSPPWLKRQTCICDHRRQLEQFVEQYFPTI